MKGYNTKHKRQTLHFLHDNGVHIITIIYCNRSRSMKSQVYTVYVAWTARALRSQRNISSRFGFLYNGVDFSWAVKLFSGAVSSPHRHNVYIIIIIISSSMLDLDLWKSQVCGTHSSPFALAVLHFRQLEVMLFRIMVWMRREQWSCFPARYQVHTVTVTNTYSQCVSPDWLLLSFSFRPTFPFR